jgi:hypothetical protein
VCKLYGNQGKWTPSKITSVYSGKILDRWIKRDYDALPFKMQLLHSISPVQYHIPIDFIYLSKDYLDQTNQLLCRIFWPGINGFLWLT